jgi:nucleoside-diphosphate-sugar epimerase
MSRPVVVILGANSHIARGLTLRFRQEDRCVLHLFTRRPGPAVAFLESVGLAEGDGIVCHHGYHDLPAVEFDAVINCVGTGTRARMDGDYSRYFTVTEEFDNLAIGCLRERPRGARYISVSSGAVYGRAHSCPVSAESCNTIAVNRVAPEDYYGIARLYAEAKHRSLGQLSIVDLRLFSYFSRFIDLSDGYFITDLLTCLIRHTTFVTSPENMVRDYLHPDDLFRMVRICLDGPAMNRAFDVVSREPIDKLQLLDHFSKAHGLQVEFAAGRRESSATGSKSTYCSAYDAAGSVGYSPAFSSLETIDMESRALLSAS